MNARQFCPRDHDTHVVGRYTNGVCKQCSKERGEDRTTARASSPNQHVKENPLAKLIPAWVPPVDEFMVPCHISTGWHKKTVDEQAAICRSCPLKADCRAAGDQFEPAGEVWGGVRIGSPDRERWHDGTCTNGHEMTPENTYRRAGSKSECWECRRARDHRRRKDTAA